MDSGSKKERPRTKRRDGGLMDAHRSLPPGGSSIVEAFLRAKGTTAKVVLLPESTATAQDAAHAVGAEVHCIGKSIVFTDEAVIVVAVVPGDESVSIEDLRQITGYPGLRKASAKEVKEATGFPIGGVSPFCLPLGIRVVVDEKISGLNSCWVAAGNPRAVTEISGMEVVRLSGAEVGSISIFKK
jgi:prolyl-tRNA editing enzyme YbaK/EbsC (Cys-tRNA(Pro) deacylase)